VDSADVLHSSCDSCIRGTRCEAASKLLTDLDLRIGKLPPEVISARRYGFPDYQLRRSLDLWQAARARLLQVHRIVGFPVDMDILEAMEGVLEAIDAL